MFNLFKELPQQIIKFNEPMKEHTSFKTGGNAKYFIMPCDIDQLKYTIDICKVNNIQYYIIGNGSNLLVSDKGFDGAIIQIYKNMNRFSVLKNTINAQAGIGLSKLANIALDNKLTGFEFASGIPGTLGGAVTMNAGAYGGEIKQVIKNSTVIDSECKIYTLTKDELELDYRTSIVSKNNLIVLNAEIELEFGDYNKIKACMQDLNERRKQKQPLEFPSAGSTFKRPINNFAGKLIMDSGLQGFCVGDAQVSQKHCGFIINKGNATSNDILNLIKHVQRTVKQRFDIDLEPEIKLVGNF